MSGRLDVEAVKAGLHTTAVLDAYGVRYHDAPTIRLALCPRCGATSRREAIAIDRTTGRWVHHSGPSAADAPCRGDILELVAAFAGLDRHRDFVRVLEVAAPIAGITECATSAELDMIRARREREQVAYERARAERRAAATAAVPGRWERLARRSESGEAYLANRGLDPGGLIARDAVRFWCASQRHADDPAPDDPVVRLHGEDGAIVNLAVRRRDPSARVKSPVLPSCTTAGTLVGRVDEIDCRGEGPDVAVLVEGVTDSLAAVLAFPGCVVVGAHCADRLPHVAAAVAPRLAAARGWLLVVPDVDGGKGEDRAADAVLAAMRAGLKLDESIHLVDVRPHKDLADAVCAGWQWRWS